MDGSVSRTRPFLHARSTALPPKCHSNDGPGLTGQCQHGSVDDIDDAIIGELSENCRLPVAEIGRRVGLSPPAVRERITRLERDGVIVGYRAIIDPASRGLPVSAWVRVRPGPRQLDATARLAQEMTEVSECHRITGDDCFLLLVHVASIGALEEVLDRFLLHGQTVSSFVVSTPVPPRNATPRKAP